MKNDMVKCVGTCEVILTGPDGKIKVHDVHKNLVMNLGIARMIENLAGTPGTKIAFIGIGFGAGGAGAPAYTQTNLQSAAPPGIYASKKAAAYSVTVVPGAGTGTFRLSATWGATEPTGATFPVGIVEIGTFDNVTLGAGLMFSRVIRSTLNKESADTLTINYDFTITY